MFIKGMYWQIKIPVCDFSFTVRLKMYEYKRNYFKQSTASMNTEISFKICVTEDWTMTSLYLIVT